MCVSLFHSLGKATPSPTGLEERAGIHLVQLAAGEESHPGHLQSHEAGKQGQLGGGFDIGEKQGQLGGRAGLGDGAHPWTGLSTGPPAVNARW